MIRGTIHRIDIGTAKHNYEGTGRAKLDAELVVDLVIDGETYPGRLSIRVPDGESARDFSVELVGRTFEKPIPPAVEIPHARLGDVCEEYWRRIILGAKGPLRGSDFGAAFVNVSMAMPMGFQIPRDSEGAGGW